MADLNKVKRQDGGGGRFQKPLTPPPPDGYTTVSIPCWVTIDRWI